MTDSIKELYFPSLAGGVWRTAPPRQLSDPAGRDIWRNSLNVIPRDGRLVGRPVLTANSDTGPTWDLGANDTGTELPRFIHSSFIGGGDHIVWVSNRSIWIRSEAIGGWFNCTPTYTVGTITATNGSANITGAGGMLWVTRGITANQFILIDGTYYKISAVTGETAITLASNFTGATAAGKAYVIRRMWNGGGFSNSSEVFATIYNEDLYVAGTYIGGADGAVRPAVIKVANIYSATPTTTYLTADRDLTGSLDFISGLTKIVGIAALQDGRLVFGGNKTEVFYSSHLNTAVWTVSPAGSTPLADLDDELRAQGRILGALTFHSVSRIVTATSTNLSDPPLSFQTSSSEYGCVAPMTLKSFGAGEMFLCWDGEVRFFDGHQSVGVSRGDMPFRQREYEDATTYPMNPDHDCEFHAAVFSRRGQYVLFRGSTDGAITTTTFWVYHEGSWWQCKSSRIIGCVSDYHRTDTSLSFGGNLAGTYGTQAVPATLMFFGEQDADDGDVSGGYFVETDDLDMGEPLLFKTPQCVIVWQGHPTQNNNKSVTVAARAVSEIVEGFHGEGVYTYSGSVTPTTKPAVVTIFQPGQLAAVPASYAHRYKISGTLLQSEMGIGSLLVRTTLTGSWESA